MGKTYKDQRKWERKTKDRDDGAPKGKRKDRPRHENEYLPDDEPLDKYEQYDYDYDDE